MASVYCIAKATYFFPLVGCKKAEHLKSNIKTLSLHLSEDDIREIEKGYVFDPGFPHTFLSGTMYADEASRGAFKTEDIWLTKFTGNFDWVEGGKLIPPVEI